MVLVRQYTSSKGFNLERHNWSGPYRVKFVNHPQCMFEQEGKMVHVRRRSRYVATPTVMLHLSAMSIDFIAPADHRMYI